MGVVVGGWFYIKIYSRIEKYREMGGEEPPTLHPPPSTLHPVKERERESE